MKLYIIRHGETAWNHLRKLQGRTDIPLNDAGRDLARATAKALREIPFAAAFTSPLVRAKETAQLLLMDRQVPLIIDERIMEISFGVFEGTEAKNAKGQITNPVLYDFFQRPQCYVAPQGAERIEELYARTGAFLKDLSQREDLMDKHVLVSTHGAASRAMLAQVLGVDIADFWCGGVPANCAVSVMEWNNGSWIMKEQDKRYYENI